MSALLASDDEAEQVKAQLRVLLQRLAEHMRRHPPRRSALVRCAMRFRGIGKWICWREILTAAEACWTAADFELTDRAEELLGEPACNRLMVAELATTGLYVSDGADYLRAVLDAPGSL